MKGLTKPELFHFQSAQGWLELGNYEEAHAELDHLSAERQGQPDILKLRVEVFIAQKKWEQGLECSAALIQSAPDQPLGWFHRSYCLHELKRTEEARDNLLRVVERFPGSATIRYNLACYECQLGRLDQARQWLEKACNVGGEDEIKSMALQDNDLKPLWDEIQSSR